MFTNWFSQDSLIYSLSFITNDAEKPPEGLVTVNERLLNPQKTNILWDLTSFSLGLGSIQRSWSVLDLFCELVSNLGLRKDVHSSVKTITSLGKR